MKKFILLSCGVLCFLLLKAQDNNSSRSETMLFLKLNFFNQEIIHLKWIEDRGSSKWRKYYEHYLFKNVQFNNCSLSFDQVTKQYIVDNTGAKNTGVERVNKITLNLNKIESISQSIVMNESGANNLYKLIFRQFNDNREIYILEVPLTSFPNFTTINSIHKNVFTAFKHLFEICSPEEP